MPRHTEKPTTEKPSLYTRALWTWFLSKAKWHNGYGWSDIPAETIEHLKECGVDMVASSEPDVGTVSEFTDPYSSNAELEAVAVQGYEWGCNCGKYGLGCFRRPTLGIPGAVPLSEIIPEVLAVASKIEAEERA